MGGVAVCSRWFVVFFAEINTFFDAESKFFLN